MRRPTRTRIKGTRAEIFSIWCSLPPEQRDGNTLIKVVRERYLTETSDKDILYWMKQSDWKRRAEQFDETLHNQVANEVTEVKGAIIRPIMEQMVEIEAKGWAKLAWAVENTNERVLSTDTKALGTFAKVLLDITKLRIVQEGGVSDRVGMEVKRLSDDELIAEIEALTGKLEGTEVKDDAEDLEYDLLADLEEFAEI